MSNQISGRVIGISKEQTVASADQSRQPLRKREIYIDCTRYDPYTGERSQYENKPLLEFSGDKVLEKVNPKLDTIKKDDIVTISFDIQGTPYTEKATGKTKVYTAIRCYDIEVRRKAGEAAPAPAPATQAPASAPQEPAPMAQSPFVGEAQAQGQQKDPNLPF